MVTLGTLASIVGILVLVITLYFFNRGKLSGRELIIAIGIAGLLTLSQPLISFIQFIRELLGVRSTFLVAFFFTTVFNVMLILYLLVRMNKLREEVLEIWQEISIAKHMDGEYPRDADKK